MKPTKISSVFILTAALAAFSSGTLAANITNVQSARAVNQWQDLTSIQSTKTRAEVRSELNQAESKGTSEQQEYVDFSRKIPPNSTSRAQVKSEVGQSTAKQTLSPRDVYYGG